MGLFGKSKKEREKEYMNRLDVPLCLKEDFELIIDDVFTIMGVGTVATGNISTGMCREGENACVYKTNGGVLETIITTIDIHTKERKSNGCGYKTEHVGLGLRGVSKEQLEKGDALAKYNQSNPIKVYGDNTITSKDKAVIRRMAAYIGVSYTALVIRLRDMGLFEYHNILEYISNELNLGGVSQ